MKANRSKILILLSFSVLLLAFCSLTIYRGFIAPLENQTPSRTPINCAEGFNEGMSPAEVSTLMNIPLLKMTWLPSDLGTSPDVRPHGLQSVDSSNGVTCIIRMTYHKLATPVSGTFRNDLLVDLLLFKQEARTPYPRSCGTIGLETPRSDSEIRCSGEFSTSKGIVAFYFFTDYPLDVAQKILEGIELSSD